MGKVMKFFALTAVLCCCLPTTVTATMGDWGEVERCPNGQVAVGFALKIPKGDDDGTAVNSISLKCAGGSWIYSAQGPSGEWGRNAICPQGGYLTACLFRVQAEQGDTSITSVDCYCNVLVRMLGDGLNKGDWQDFPATICGNGVTGIQTRVRGKTGEDNTAITDAKLFCN